MKRLVSVLATTAATAGVLLAVDSAADSAPPAGAKAQPVITISGFAFSGKLTVRPGVTVKVVNNDAVAHTFSNPKGRFDTGTIPAHSSKTFVAPRRVADYQARCNIHTTMTTVLHVKAP